MGKRAYLGTLLAVFAWFFECVAFYLVFMGFDERKISLLSATFIYAFSTLAGAISMLPGGLGATEGSMTALLIVFKLKPELSAVATIIIRACTLWFGVIVGFFSYFLYRKVLKEVKEEVLEEKISSRGKTNAF